MDQKFLEHESFLLEMGTTWKDRGRGRGVVAEQEHLTETKFRRDSLRWDLTITS